MRIGVVTTSYPRHAADPAGIFVAGMARFLAGRGHEVEVIAAGPGATRDGAIPIHRVRAGAALFYDEGAPDRLERRPSTLALAPVFGAAVLAAAARRARRWDGIVAHWLVPSALAAAPLRPTLAIAHSGDVHLIVRLGLADAVAGALVLAGSRVVFVAEHLRERFLGAMRARGLRERLAARSSVCPMGVEPPAPRDRAAARHRLGLPAEGQIVAFLGRLVPIKGVETLIQAVPDGATLVVAGDGPLRAALAAAAPRARFTGTLTGEAKADLFAAVDVLALPSHAIGDRVEGAPTVLAEGMAAGVPVVASDTPGAREMCGDAALYSPPGDRVALRSALAQALADSTERILRGRARGAALSWSVVGEHLLGMIDAWSRRMPNQQKGKGGMTVEEAGRMGGSKVAAERGPEFYSEIGQKGGAKISRDRAHMSEIGHRGGERVRELIARGKETR